MAEGMRKSLAGYTTNNQDNLAAVCFVIFMINPIMAFLVFMSLYDGHLISRLDYTESIIYERKSLYKSSIVQYHFGIERLEKHFSVSEKSIPQIHPLSKGEKYCARYIVKYYSRNKVSFEIKSIYKNECP